VPLTGPGHGIDLPCGKTAGNLMQGKFLYHELKPFLSHARLMTTKSMNKPD